MAAAYGANSPASATTGSSSWGSATSADGSPDTESGRSSQSPTACPSGGSSDDTEEPSAEQGCLQTGECGEGSCLRRSRTEDRLVDALRSNAKTKEQLRSSPVLYKVLAGPAVALVVLFLHFGVFRFGDAFDGRNWWTCMAACLLIWVPLTALTMSVNLSQWVHPGLPLGRVMLRTVAIGSTVFVSVWSPLLFLGKDLGYKPAPFVGYLAATMAGWTMACYGWFAIPADLRSQTDVRLRLKGTAIFNSQLLFFVLAYDLVLATCRIFCRPLTVLAFAALHTFLNQAVKRLLHMVDESDTKTFTGFYFVHTLHIVFLTTYILDSTSWLVAATATAVDLLINFKYLIVIATGQRLRTLLLRGLAPPCVARALARALPPPLARWLAEDAETEDERDRVRVKAGSRMVVTETNEMLQPLLYFVVVSVIYHGRNADAMAGVGASKFGVNALHGTGQLWGRIAIMIAMDVFTCIITVIVTRSTQVDLFDFYLAEVERHWLPIALLQVWVLDTVLCEEAIGCFVDFSFKFKWMH